MRTFSKVLLLASIYVRLIATVLLLFFLESCFVNDEFKPDPKPCPDLPIVFYEGDEYPTVQIGDQCWMAKNLNIGQIIHTNQEMENNGSIERYCYLNREILCKIFGGLYQWDEMMQYSVDNIGQGICPDGWRIPSKHDFNILNNFAPSKSYLVDNQIINWKPYPEDKSTGFNALPSGHYQHDDQEFYSLYRVARFWSSEINEDQLFVFEIFSKQLRPQGIIGNVPLDLYDERYAYPRYDKKNAHSVRCIKNE